MIAVDHQAAARSSLASGDWSGETAMTSNPVFNRKNAQLAKYLCRVLA